MDIAMCADKDCPSRLNCYRFTAPKSEFLQSYGQFERGHDDKCEFYWPIEEATHAGNSHSHGVRHVNAGSGV